MNLATTAPVACGAGIVGATAYLALNDPAAPGAHLPACPFFASTGLWCPGCGLTRATHALLHGHIATAFGFNALFPLFLGAIVVGWFAWWRGSRGRPPIAWLVKLPMWLIIAAGVAVIAFGVVRNMPGLEALAP
ncbi:MAG: DUF2752 domain-containing protein [Actinomycetota bacterium]|jgi:hypothetical protein